MIILRQKEYARRDYQDKSGNPLPKDLINKVSRERKRLASEVKYYKKKVDRDYKGEGSKFFKMFLPDKSGDIEERNERYQAILNNTKEAENYIRNNARAINYFRKKKN